MNSQSLGVWLLAIPLAGAAAASGPPSKDLLGSLEPPALAGLAVEVLERNPELARDRQRAAAAAARAPQVRALPDPVAALTLYILPPETRVGPQQASVSLSQKLPWLGKLSLREKAALYEAAAAEAETEALRLELITETRRLFYELSFHEEHLVIAHAERVTLVRFEEVSKARYVSGTGLQQEILRIQAQITRLDTRLVEVEEAEAGLLAAVNALRDRPAQTPVGGLELPALFELQLDGEALRQDALARPELAAAEARIARQGVLVELAEMEFRPDFTLGLGFTSVGSRDDAAGRAMPPQGNGNDILSFMGSVNLPVRRGKLRAGLAEALALRRAAEDEKRRVAAGIERAVGELRARLPLLYEHSNLLENVLRIQAREALQSAEAAYTIGKLNAVDLLDAEVVLLDVSTAAARTLTDYAVTRARLEHAVARPLAAREDTRHDD